MISAIITILLLVFLISYIVRSYQEFSLIHSRWHYHFDELRFSPQEFYSKVEEIIRKKEIPKVSFERRSYFEASVLSDKREYLTVSQGEHRFLICAAPYGTGFFVSWWLGETITFIKDMLTRIPFIGSYIAKFSASKTYFQMDTESMFKESIRACVNEAIDAITKAKGIRGLSELDKKPIDTQR